MNYYFTLDIQFSNGKADAKVLNTALCFQKCTETCQITPGIIQNKCDGLCRNHCHVYEFDIEAEKVKCLLLCRLIKYCAEHQKTDVSKDVMFKV